ncbi:MAG: hypothetical protein O3C40_37610 [Planctomycetota bacterium]|nr:hypothetical protein [Planctomycetota bacterium]
MVALNNVSGQLPLIHLVESDDLYLQDQPDVLWFEVLRNLDYHPFQGTAAHYYERLWQFNQRQAQQRKERRECPLPANPETEPQAIERLLFSRATLDDTAAILFEQPELETPAIEIGPYTVRPGVTPPRFAGREPKCFFAMLYAFLGVTLAGERPEPQWVHQKLRENPAFTRTCGFTIPRPGMSERASDIPSLRKLQQFDQIMTENGLWEEIALDQVAANLRAGKVEMESTLVHDTTHYHAWSSMTVVELPEAASASEQATEPSGDATDPKRTQEPPPSTGTTKQTKKKAKKKQPKKQRKSHPRTTKACRCVDREHCPHAWSNADDGAGTVVKSTGKMYWAHKASTLSFADQEILLDAVAMNDAASHDSQSLQPHLRRLFQRHPDLEQCVTRVLDDAAADDAELKSAIQIESGIELLAPINPRRRGRIVSDLPRGIDHLTPRGVPVCGAGYPFELVGVRHDTEHFLFRAPQDEAGTFVCQGCALREGCYRGDQGGRQVAIPQHRLPWLDPNFPQLSKRFEKAMARRTSIERLHKLMKFDLGDDRLTKRGNDSFQARLDKTLFAMHVLIGQDH